MTDRSTSSTVLGFIAILFWSTSIGFSRSLIEKLGPLTAATCIFLLSGVLGCAYLTVIGGGLRRALKLPTAYLLGCGGLFVLYEVCLYLAIGLAAGRPQVLEVGVINYLWPGLTLAFAVPILKRRAGVLLLPGIVIAFAGVVLAMAGGDGLSWGRFVEHLCAGPAPYALALVAAVTWALYSNLARKWAGDAKGSAVPLFLLAAGVLLAGLRFAFPEESNWNLSAVSEVLFMALVPSLLAYVFWDAAMRRGRMTLVAAFSYLTPLLSMVVSCLYLRVSPGWNLWVACVLVIGGAVLCKRSIRPELSAPAT